MPEDAESSPSPVPGILMKVELFEDRAAVTRRVPVSGEGRHQFTVGPITALVREQAISFPSGSTSVVVEELRVVRRRSTLTEQAASALEDLQIRAALATEAREAQADAVTRSNEAHQRALRATQAAQAATVRALQEHEQPSAWVRSVENLAGRLRQAIVAVGAAEAELATCVAREAELIEELERAREGEPVLEGFLEISVLAQAAGDLQVRYVVPCALWRPAHRAQLVTTSSEDGSDTAELTWEQRAVCWNATGEDWTDAKVLLTTARPGERVEPPSLTDDLVTVQPRYDVVVADVEDEEVARPFGVQATTSLPGVDDGGSTFTFTLPEPLDLPSDGRPVAVALDRWTAPATFGLFAFPEQSQTAIVRSEQVNESGRALLAGPVELVRDGYAVGRSQVGLIAADATFSVGWGSDDAVQIVRRRAHEVARVKATGRQTHTFRIELDVHYSGSEPGQLELRERVPVSEVKDISVSDPEVLPPAETDDDGFCTWSLKLTPGEAHKIELSYVVRASGRVQLPFHGP